METPSYNAELEAQPLDCCMSPSANLLAAALVTGQLQLLSFAMEPSSSAGDAPAAACSISASTSRTIPPPQRSAAAPSQAPTASSEDGEDEDEGEDAEEAPSCRATCFTSGGAAVLGGYSDALARCYDAETGQLKGTYTGHKKQLSKLFSWDEHVFASGDEGGGVLVWDTRVGAGPGAAAAAGSGAAPVYRYSAHRDYITDFAKHEKAGALVVTSGDGTLSIHDMRTRKVLARSEEDADDELLSCVVVKGGKKVVAGTQSGVVHLYSWGYFNDCSDRFPGHPESVQSLAVWDEDTVLTGSSDGGIRIIGVLPNKLMGILGQHNQDFPVERLALSHDRRVLASLSHDSCVKLWDMGILLDDDEDDEGEEGGEGEEGVEAGQESDEEALDAMEAMLLAAARKQKGRGKGKKGAVEEDEDGEDDEDEDFEGSEEGESDDEDVGGSSSGGEGEDEEDEEASGSGAADDDEGRQAGGAVGRKQQAAAVAAAGGKKRAAEGKAAVAAAGGGKDGKAAKLAAKLAGKLPAGAGASGSGDDDSGADSDDSDDGGKRKKAKRERTKWTKHAEQNKKPSGNFFADLL